MVHGLNCSEARGIFSDQIAFKLILVAAVLPYFSSLLKRIFVTIIIVSFSSHDVHSILLLFSPLPFHTDDQ